MINLSIDIGRPPIRKVRLGAIALCALICVGIGTALPDIATAAACEIYDAANDANEDAGSQLAAARGALANPSLLPQASAANMKIADTGIHAALVNIHDGVSQIGNQQLIDDYTDLLHAVDTLSSVTRSLVVYAPSQYYGNGLYVSGGDALLPPPPSVWPLVDKAEAAQQKLFLDIQSARRGCS